MKVMSLAAALALFVGGTSCEGGEALPDQVVQEITALKGDCDLEKLETSDEACVQSFEYGAGRLQEMVATYIGAMRTMDAAFDRMPPVMFDTAGLGRAITLDPALLEQTKGNFSFERDRTPSPAFTPAVYQQDQSAYLSGTSRGGGGEFTYEEDEGNYATDSFDGERSPAPSPSGRNTYAPYPSGYGSSEYRGGYPQGPRYPAGAYPPGVRVRGASPYGYGAQPYGRGYHLDPRTERDRWDEMRDAEQLDRAIYETEERQMRIRSGNTGSSHNQAPPAYYEEEAYELPPAQRHRARPCTNPRLLEYRNGNMYLSRWVCDEG